jgi:hypothetical protein
MSRSRAAGSTTSTSKTSKSERLEFAEALNAFKPQIEKLTKMTEILQEFTSDTLTKLDLEIESKKTECNVLQEEYKSKLKNEQIQLDLYLREHEYNGAIEILTKHGEVPIASEELAELRSDLEKSQQSHQTELDVVRKEEQTQSKIALASAIKMKELEHQANTAELNARVKELGNEIVSLKSTIETLRDELSKQRELTKSVAEAGKQGAITQQFGKS